MTVKLFEYLVTRFKYTNSLLPRLKLVSNKYVVLVGMSTTNIFVYLFLRSGSMIQLQLPSNIVNISDISFIMFYQEFPPGCADKGRVQTHTCLGAKANHQPTIRDVKGNPHGRCFSFGTRRLHVLRGTLGVGGVTRKRLILAELT